MNKAGGFITLHRQVMDWEWYKDTNTAFLFFHLLLSANFTDTRFKGKLIKRGQIVTSLPSLSTETGLSIQQVRTALLHLTSTGEITDESTPNYRIITVVKYDDYQNSTDRSTGDQQTSNRQVNRRSTDRSTGDQQHHNNNNNINNVNKETMEQVGEDRTAQRFSKPTRDEILAFCQENGLTIDADRFIDYYTSNGWMVGRNHMKDWKAAVRNWAKGDNSRSARSAPAKKATAQDFPQRDYSDVPDDDMARLAAEMEQARRDGII